MRCVTFVLNSLFFSLLDSLVGRFPFFYPDRFVLPFSRIITDYHMDTTTLDHSGGVLFHVSLFAFYLYYCCFHCLFNYYVVSVPIDVFLVTPIPSGSTLPFYSIPAFFRTRVTSHISLTPHPIPSKFCQELCVYVLHPRLNFGRNP